MIRTSPPVPMAGALARSVSNGIAPVPVHDYGALTCSNTYCHGNWKARKSIRRTSSSIWIRDGGRQRVADLDRRTAGGNRGTCLAPSILPTRLAIVPQGHTPFAVTAAPAVIPRCGRGGKISDKSLHVNGKINVFGSERSF